MHACSPQGQGTLYDADGSVYVGGFAGGLRQGRGRQREPCGGTLDGAFEAGRAAGPGVQTSARGDVFRGAFAGGLREGPGSYEFADGARLDAVYVAGAPRRAAAPPQVPRCWSRRVRAVCQTQAPQRSVAPSRN